MTKFELPEKPKKTNTSEDFNNLRKAVDELDKFDYAWKTYADKADRRINAANKYIEELERENQRLVAENLALKTLVDSAKQQQSLPVVPEFVAGSIESIPDHYSAFEAIDLIKSKVEILTEENKDWLPVYNWLCEGIENQDIFALAFITRKYKVEKIKLESEIKALEEVLEHGISTEFVEDEVIYIYSPKTAHDMRAKLEENYKQLHAQLTISKSIADELDSVFAGIDATDIGYVLDQTGPYGSRAFNDYYFKNKNVIALYLAGKALGVDLVKVV